METFSALLALCVGNSPVPGEFPSQRPVTRSFDVFFDLRLNKRLSKESWDWWFETTSRTLWPVSLGYDVTVMNGLAADGLTIWWVRTTVVMVLTYFVQKFPVSVRYEKPPCKAPKIPGNKHYIAWTSWWARWRLKSPVSRLFAQPSIQAQIKEYIKAPRYWPLCRKFTSDRWIPRIKGQ